MHRSRCDMSSLRPITDRGRAAASPLGSAMIGSKLLPLAHALASRTRARANCRSVIPVSAREQCLERVVGVAHARRTRSTSPRSFASEVLHPARPGRARPRLGGGDRAGRPGDAGLRDRGGFQLDQQPAPRSGPRREADLDAYLRVDTCARLLLGCSVWPVGHEQRVVREGATSRPNR